MTFFSQIKKLTAFGLALSLATLTSSCQPSNFSGDNNVRSANQKPKPNPYPKPCQGPACDPAPPTVSPPPPDQLSTDTGGFTGINQCADGQAIEDPTQTYTWRGKLRAGDDIQGFVNSFKKYTLVTVGALHNDAATAKFVCQLNGYVGGVVTRAGSFASPKNNNIYRWDPNQKKLIPANAASDNNTIRDYLCAGKLKDPCKQDQSWIFQDLP